MLLTLLSGISSVSPRQIMSCSRACKHASRLSMRLCPNRNLCLLSGTYRPFALRMFSVTIQCRVRCCLETVSHRLQPSSNTTSELLSHHSKSRDRNITAVSLPDTKVVAAFWTDCAAASLACNRIARDRVRTTVSGAGAAATAVMAWCFCMGRTVTHHKTNSAMQSS